MKTSFVIAAVAVLSWATFALSAEARLGPPGAGPIPDGVGTNIHFTDPKPGEMKMIGEGGFRWLRMDFSWGGTERKRGEYDFTPYDRLVEAGKATGTRFVFILDYTNNLYEKDNAVRTEEGRQAMAKWATAAVLHFKGRGILWEMWNEPNISVFWKPQPNVEEYVKLALTVGKALHEAAPDEMHVGPAASTIDFAFLEACFKGGLLEYWSAVTVHPYRQQPPETVQGEYRRLRALIRQYAPKGKSIPIISGEWGFASVWGGFDVDKQGKYLPRQWLTNLSNDVPLSIWYDWHDDGTDPKDGECHFGTVLHAEHAGQDPLYTPKPAYQAARTLTTVLKGYRFNKRLVGGIGATMGADDYVLLFAKDGSPSDVALVAWTTTKDAHEVVIPASPGAFHVRSHTGEELADITADKAGLKLQFTDAPKYLLPSQPNDLLRVAAAWQRVPLDITGRAGKGLELPLTLANPLTTPIRASIATGAGAPADKPVEIAPGQTGTLVCRYDLTRTAGGVPLEVVLEVEGIGIHQRTTAEATNPLGLTAMPPTWGPPGPRAGGVAVHVTNPSGEAFTGTLELTKARVALPAVENVALELKAGQTEATVRMPLADLPADAISTGPAEVPLDCTFGLRVCSAGGAVELEIPPVTFAAVDDFGRYTNETFAKAYRVIGDGDAKVASTQFVNLAKPPDGPPPGGAKSLRIAYDMSKGWKFVQLQRQGAVPLGIEGKPKSLGMWLWSAGTGLSPRLRFTDATGQTFQPAGEPMTWKGWRYVTFPLDGQGVGHWGGADDGVVHYPIHWSSLLLIDKPQDQTAMGEVYIAAPTLVR